MKKELIRSLAAINQASSAMLVTQYHSEQALQRRTTVNESIEYLESIIDSFSVLDGSQSQQ